jgi:hypothetical protein
MSPLGAAVTDCGFFPLFIRYFWRRRVHSVKRAAPALLAPN